MGFDIETIFDIAEHVENENECEYCDENNTEEMLRGDDGIVKDGNK